MLSPFGQPTAAQTATLELPVLTGSFTLTRCRERMIDKSVRRQINRSDLFFYPENLEVRGLEPLTYGLQSHRSSQLSYTPEFTVGLLLHAVSKLAYMMQKVELFREYPAKLTSHVSSKKKEGGATSVAKELGEYV